MRTTVFWVLTPCSLLEIYGRFGNSKSGGRKFRRNIHLHQTTRRQIPWDQGQPEADWTDLTQSGSSLTGVPFFWVDLRISNFQKYAF
jgi:hypothetical protein